MEQKKGHIGYLYAELNGVIGDDLHISRSSGEPELEFVLYTQASDKGRMHAWFPKIRCLASAQYTAELMQAAMEERTVYIDGYFDTDTVYSGKRRRFVRETLLHVEYVLVCSGKEGTRKKENAYSHLKAQGIIVSPAIVSKHRDGWQSCFFDLAYGAPIFGDDRLYVACRANGELAAKVKALHEEDPLRICRFEGHIREEKQNPVILLDSVIPTDQKTADYIHLV